MDRTPLCLRGVWCLIVVFMLVGSLSLPVPLASAQPSDTTLVYHQLTSLAEGSGSVGFPVLSADGTTGVFVDAPGTGDPATPNRIFTISIDNGGISEVDSYQSLCFCGSKVDISADGSTVVSTDGVQVRVADGGGPRELLVLASGEITALVISGDGETVVFLVRRDTATLDNETTLTRGIWAIDADGENLRQIVSADEVGAAVGVPVEQTGCCFHADGQPLDVSDNGDRIVFGAFAGDGEHVFSVEGDGGEPRVLRGPVQFAMRVAVSGDGSTVAFDVLPPESSTNEIATVAFDGGDSTVFSLPPSAGLREPLQLSRDGSQLLVSPNGLLIDTATGEARLLAVSISGLGGNHEAVLGDGLVRATMDAEARRFLYAMRTVRCADCANSSEQLATLDIGPDSLGGAPVIVDASIDPATIALEYASESSVEVTVETTGTVLGVGFAALLDGEVNDVNVGHGRVLLDDGQNGDVAANDGTYTVAGIVHGYVASREDDTGPRTVRIAVEIEDSDGRRHATAVDIGTLTVSDD